MKVAALYDIHGNLPALEAVLREVDSADADLIVVGGDIVPGPMPVETLERLLEVKTPMEFIKGNGETAVLRYLRTGSIENLPDHAIQAVKWCAEQLSFDHTRLISKWNSTFRMEMPTFGDVLFCHATPRDENEIFTIRTPEEKLLTIFNDANSSIVVCGHTHMQFKRKIGNTLVVNAGSAGMPIGKTGAYRLMLGAKVELKCSSYDLADAANQIQNTSFPNAKAFAGNLVNPPAENEILDLYEK